jgi:hypothetical protein
MDSAGDGSFLFGGVWMIIYKWLITSSLFLVISLAGCGVLPEKATSSPVKSLEITSEPGTVITVTPTTGFPTGAARTVTPPVDNQVTSTSAQVPSFEATPSPLASIPGRMAFVSDLGDNFGLYTANSDGTGLVKVFDDLAWIANPAWAPDGKWIAFSAFSPRDGHNAIYRIRPDGSDLTQLNQAQGDQTNPTWSADGLTIGYTMLNDLWLGGIDGSAPVQLTHNTFRLNLASLSPDGKWIVFTADTDDGPELFTTRVDGTGGNQLTRSPFSGTVPVWAPDSSEIAFTGYMNSQAPETMFQVRLDGSSPERLAQSGLDQTFLAWSPDGKSFVYEETDPSGGSQVKVAKLSGGNPSTILNLYLYLGSLSWGTTPNLASTATPSSPGPTPAPPMPDDWQKAQLALQDYFTALSAGQFDRAAGLYGGSYELLLEGNPYLEPHNHAALLGYACQSRYPCGLRVKSIYLKSQSTNQFTFTLEFTNPDGSPFVLGPCCGADATQQPPVSTFDFKVTRKQDGRFLVLDLPVAMP